MLDNDKRTLREAKLAGIKLMMLKRKQKNKLQCKPNVAQEVCEMGNFSNSTYRLVNVRQKTQERISVGAAVCKSMNRDTRHASLFSAVSTTMVRYVISPVWLKYYKSLIF